MNRKPMIPPNFVTLRQLKEIKEKREEEERLKREEEQRLRKLKEEEEERERLRKIEEEEKRERLRKLMKEDEERERLRKLKKEKEASSRNPPPKTLGSSRPPPHRRNYGRAGSRPSANPQVQLCGDGRSDLDGAIADVRLGCERRLRPRANPEVDVDGTNLEEQVAVNGGSESSFSNREEHKRWKNGKKKKKCKQRKKASSAEDGGITEMPLGLNGSEAVPKGVGALADEKMERGEKIKEKLPARVMGSESGVICVIEKRVSDLKIGGRNPNPDRGGRGWGRGFSGWPRGRGRGGGGTMWVRKTMDC